MGGSKMYETLRLAVVTIASSLQVGNNSFIAWQLRLYSSWRL